MGNTVKAGNGVEVYESRIHELADDYTSLFTGMIKYIYKYLFKHTLSFHLSGSGSSNSKTAILD